jgi:apolipoprotein N-acyltransferase
METSENEQRDLRLKRLQRGSEYALLIAMHAFFLISFRQYYTWWMALVLFLIMFGLNFQLTQLREGRRAGNGSNRGRIVADIVESFLFILFIFLLYGGESAARKYGITDPEYLAYVAAILTGIFLAGFLGELYWQRKILRSLDEVGQHAYIANLKRTIILPYISSRPRRMP